jgi:hypothetical protein
MWRWITHAELGATMHRWDKSFLALSLLMVLVPSAIAQRVPFQPDNTLTGIGGLDGLLLLQSVQKELKLGDEQAQQVKEVVRATRQKHRAAFDELMKPEIGQEERRRKVLQLMEQVSRESMDGLKEILAPEQTRRLKQIALQERGLQAFSDPEVGKALKLTSGQREKIDALAENATREMREILQTKSRGNYQEVLGKLAGRRRQMVEQALAVLDPDQKRGWKQLVGEPFEIKYDQSSIRRPDQN